MNLVPIRFRRPVPTGESEAATPPMAVPTGTGVDPDAQPGAGVLIPARSERQAMDWSLALASQHIACVIRAGEAGQPWALEVDAGDAGRALRTLRLYHIENRRWRDAFDSGAGSMPFHWAVLPWCLLLLMVAWAVAAPGSRLMTVGTFSTAATAAGEWWRPLTATYLHSGIDHLAANLATGFVLLGLVMGRYGPGWGLLATLLAGTGGNLLAWLWRGHDYVGLGSSGVVMGALGMLSVSLLIDARARRIAPASVLRGCLGGIALFILLGTSPNSDVLAHAGGFLCGLLAAIGSTLLPARFRESPAFDPACGITCFGLGTLAWLVALH